MAGARLSDAPNGWRDEDCAKWLVQGLRIVPNGCKSPQHKKATIKWQFGDHAGQLKKLWCGNHPVTPAKRKMRHGNQRIALAKRKNRGAAIGVSRRPLQKNRGAAIGVLRRPLQKERHGNRSNMPATSKIAVRQS
jgi:hypothetical protein